jgi:retron-type reverse transcriptase
MNRSFGFRPNKSCHDALAALKSNNTTGLFRAIEGDIESAYDNVDKDILVNQLQRKIQDKSFIKMIRNRLNYDYVDESDSSRIRPTLGIPQGGIDSPYLFNIYLYDLDCFVNNEIQDYLDSLNTKAKINPNRTGIACKVSTKINQTVVQKKRFMSWIKSDMKVHTKSLPQLRTKLYSFIKEIRLVNHKLRQMEYIDSNKRRYRL